MGMTMEEVARNIAALGEALRKVAVSGDDIRRWGGLRDPEEETGLEQDNYPKPAERRKDKTCPRR